MSRSVEDNRFRVPYETWNTFVEVCNELNMHPKQVLEALCLHFVINRGLPGSGTTHVYREPSPIPQVVTNDKTLTELLNDELFGC